MWVECYKCKKHLPLYEFDRCKSGYLGLYSYCKECRRALRKCGNTGGKVGRPKGFRLSQDSISRISRAKTGRRRNQETRDKISQSMRKYHAEQNPLSNDLRKDHRSAEAKKWISDNKDAINNSDDIMTESRHGSIIKNCEIPVGEHIEWLAVDYRSPKYLLIAKEEAAARGMAMEDFINEMEDLF